MRFYCKLPGCESAHTMYTKCGTKHEVEMEKRAGEKFGVDLLKLGHEYYVAKIATGTKYPAYRSGLSFGDRIDAINYDDMSTIENPVAHLRAADSVELTYTKNCLIKEILLTSTQNVNATLTDLRKNYVTVLSVESVCVLGNKNADTIIKNLVETAGQATILVVETQKGKNFINGIRNLHKTTKGVSLRDYISSSLRADYGTPVPVINKQQKLSTSTNLYMTLQ